MENGAAVGGPLSSQAISAPLRSKSPEFSSSPPNKLHRSSSSGSLSTSPQQHGHVGIGGGGVGGEHVTSPHSAASSPPSPLSSLHSQHVSYRRTSSLPGDKVVPLTEADAAAIPVAATTTAAQAAAAAGAVAAISSAGNAQHRQLEYGTALPHGQNQLEEFQEYLRHLQKLQRQWKKLVLRDPALQRLDGGAAERLRMQFMHDLVLGRSTGPTGPMPPAVDSQLQFPFPFWMTVPRSLHTPSPSMYSQARFANDFVRISSIGRGGFGKVYHAQNRVDHHHYAVKRVKLKHVDKEKCMKAMREVEAIASLDHPNIVRYYSAWLELETSGASPSPPAPAGAGGALAILPAAAAAAAETGTFCPVMSSGEVSSASGLCSTYDDSRRQEFATGYGAPSWPGQQEHHRTFNYPTSHHHHHAQPGSSSSGFERVSSGMVNIPAKGGLESTDSLDIQFLAESGGSANSISSLSSGTSSSDSVTCRLSEADDRARSSGSSTSSSSSSSLLSSTQHSDCGGYQSDEEDTDYDVHGEGAHNDAVLMAGGMLGSSPERRGEIVLSTRSSRRRNSRLQSANAGPALASAMLPYRIAAGAAAGTAAGATAVDAVMVPDAVVDAGDVVNFALGSSEDTGSEMTTDTSDQQQQQQHQQQYVVLYIQMQLCQLNLLNWLCQRNSIVSSSGGIRVDEAESWRLFMEILEGVNHIHSHGLMHRDLKPANVFLYGAKCTAKIGDFGLAREDVVLSDSDNDIVMTPLEELNRPLTTTATPGGASLRGGLAGSHGGMHSQPTCGVGTSSYASPEQLEGRSYDSKSDMFSLGLILMELFTPFTTAMERASCMRDARNGKLPVGLLSRFPKQARLVRQLLSHEPRDRPDSHTLLKSIKQVQSDRSMIELQLQVIAKDKEIKNLTSKLEQMSRELKERDETIASLRAGIKH